MNKLTNYNWIFGGMLLLLLASCVNVVGVNEDDPDLETTLSISDDYPRILNGAYLSWWTAIHQDSPYMTLAVAADFGSSSWGNFAMREVGTVSKPYGLGNHSSIDNRQAANYTAYLVNPWSRLYTAISTANDVLRGIRVKKIKVSDSDRLTSITEAQALFVRGISYGYLGLLFDKGFVVDENSKDLDKLGQKDFKGYKELQKQALSDLNQVLDISSKIGEKMNISQFNGLKLNSSQTRKLTNSFIAKFLAQTPRTAEENKKVDWDKVLSASEKGIDFDFAPLGDGGSLWWHANIRLMNSGWIRVDQKIVNMVSDKHPYPFPETGSYKVEVSNIVDKRFGDEDSNADFKLTSQINFNANRGVYFYSYFEFSKYDKYKSDKTIPMVSFSEDENNLLRAEALIRTGGNLALAAELINLTRVLNGELEGLTGNEANILEHLFYERYLDAWEGPGSPFFDRRRTNDLGKKQFKEFPVPAIELSTLGAAVYTKGG